MAGDDDFASANDWGTVAEPDFFFPLHGCLARLTQSGFLRDAIPSGTPEIGPISRPQPDLGEQQSAEHQDPIDTGEWKGHQHHVGKVMQILAFATLMLSPTGPFTPPSVARVGRV